MTYKTSRFMNALCISLSFWIVVAFGLVTVTLAQGEAKHGAFKSGTESPPAELKTEIEPGVTVIGKSHRFAEVGEISSFSLSPDGSTMACAASKIKLFDLNENKVRDSLGEDGEYYQQVEYTPDGLYIVATSFKGNSSLIRVWDAIDLSLVNTIQVKQELDAISEQSQFYIQRFELSADNKHVAISSHESVAVFDLMHGKLKKFIGKVGYVQNYAFSPDERQLFLPKNGRIEAINLEEEQSSAESTANISYGNFALSVNLSRGLLASFERTSIRIKDLKGDAPDRFIALPPNTFGNGQASTFSDDGQMLVVSIYHLVDGAYHFGIVVFDVDSGRQLKRVDSVASNGLTKMQFSSDRTRLYYSGYSLFGVNEIDLTTEQPATEIKFPNSPATAIAIHPDSKSFVASSGSGGLNVFDLASGEITNSISFSNPRDLQITNGGDQILACPNNTQGKLSSFAYRSGDLKKQYSLETSQNVVSVLKEFMLNGGVGALNSQVFPITFAVSPDGSQLRTLSMEMTFRSSGGLSGADFEQFNSFKYVQLDTEHGNSITSRKFRTEQFGFGKQEWVQIGAVSRSGAHFAVARSQILHVVNAETGETSFEINVADLGDQNPGQIISVKYSPDDRFLITVLNNKTLVWDAQTGALTSELADSPGNNLVGFSADGKRMLICGNSRDSEVLLYDTTTWKPNFRRKPTQGDRRAISLSDDCQFIVFGLSDCRLEVWDLAKLK